MKVTIILTFFCSLFVFSACNNATQTTQTSTATPKRTDSTQPQEQRKPQMVGGDRDEHGCIGSAGYQWSEVRQECLRLFEKAVRLNPVDTSLRANISAFIILSENKQKAELFLPDGNKSKILTRSEKNKNSWEFETYRLRVEQTSYILEDKTKILFKN